MQVRCRLAYLTLNCLLFRELYDRDGVCKGTNHLLQGVYTESKARGMIQECLTSVSGHLKTWLEISVGANQMEESSSLPWLDPDQVVALQSFAEWIQTDQGSIPYFVLHI